MGAKMKLWYCQDGFFTFLRRGRAGRGQALESAEDFEGYEDLEDIKADFEQAFAKACA